MEKCILCDDPECTGIERHVRIKQEHEKEREKTCLCRCSACNKPYYSELRHWQYYRFNCGDYMFCNSCNQKIQQQYFDYLEDSRTKFYEQFQKIESSDIQFGLPNEKK